MTTALVPLQTNAPNAALAPLLAEEEQIISDALQSARSENTRINYATNGASV